MAKERFSNNYRKPDIKWNDIYDSTTVKAKLRLMFPKDIAANTAIDVEKDLKYKTAILFGPPGTGKTTYARALATKLGLKYLELTPGDFFLVGKTGKSIRVRPTNFKNEWYSANFEICRSDNHIKGTSWHSEE